MSDTTPFFAYEWVDDHVLVEKDVGNRLRAAATALRLNMMAILGPRALNEGKFSEWSTRLEVLGLTFDTIARTVSMPDRKIEKACRRVAEMRPSARATKTKLQELMGSLRHVASCYRSMRPFFQRVQSLCTSASFHGSAMVTDAVREDSDWCTAILTHGQLQNLPTAMFHKWPVPNVYLYMDASNQGLAVFDPARRRFIQVKFDEDEQAQILVDPHTLQFTINVREQLSVALAVLVWGSTWK